MKYIPGNTQWKLYNTAVTLGKFDGLHVGHQLLLNKVLEFKNIGYKAVAFTFLFPNKSAGHSSIYTEEEKKNKFTKMGFDAMISYPFTDEIALMEPEVFIKEILVNKLDAKFIIVGVDFCFGHNRRGNVHMLKKYSKEYGYEVIAYEKIKINNKIVSSTNIRSEILDGNIEVINDMLKMPYSVVGEVVHGKKLGRQLGTPTANVIPDNNKLLPPFGVYFSKTNVDGAVYNGITNIGCKPTVGIEQRGVETYLFDFDGDLYGKVISVEIYHFERSEKKFQSIEELSSQMQKDIVEAKKYFNHN